MDGVGGRVGKVEKRERKLRLLLLFSLKTWRDKRKARIGNGSFLPTDWPCHFSFLTVGAVAVGVGGRLRADAHVLR